MKYAAAVLLLLMTLVFGGTANPARAEDRLGAGATVPVENPGDRAVRQRLSASFARIEAFRGVDIQVQDGVAVLSGGVRSFAAADKALELASRVEGVLYVVDRVEVDAKVDSFLAQAWSKSRQVLERALGFAPLLAIAAGILLAFLGAGRLVTSWEWPYRRLEKRVLLQGLIRQLVRYLFLFAGLMIALEILGLASLLGAFMGAAGVIGLALGFAFKDIVENYLAGFLLSIHSPFSFMDWIAVGGHQGSVVRVTSRELVIMTLEGNHVRIPNSQVFKGVICNFTRNPLRRFDIDLGIGVGEDLSRVQEIGVSVLQAMKGVAEDPGPAMRNRDFGDSAMLVSFSGWVDQTNSDFLKVRSEAVRLLKEALDSAGVDVPAPIQQVVNVDGGTLAAAPAPKPATPRELQEDAKRADVGRESHLDEQIAEDRRTSQDVDLLSKN